MESAFLAEAYEARKELAEIAIQYPVKDNIELRTSIDTLLVMYDQAIILAGKMINTIELYQELKELKQQ